MAFNTEAAARPATGNDLTVELSRAAGHIRSGSQNATPNAASEIELGCLEKVVENIGRSVLQGGGIGIATGVVVAIRKVDNATGNIQNNGVAAVDIDQVKSLSRLPLCFA